MNTVKAMRTVLAVLTGCICGCSDNEIARAMFSQSLPTQLSIQVSPVSRKVQDDGLDPNQLRLAVERPFRRCGVEIVEPDFSDPSSSRIIIDLAVRHDPNTQLYSCQATLILFNGSSDPKKRDEPNFNVRPERITGVSPSDMPAAVRNQVGSALLGLALFYLPDEEKEELIEAILEGFFIDPNEVGLPILPECRTTVLENKPKKVNQY